MFTLERYCGPKSRHTCPSCGKSKEFARYVNEIGEYLAADVGRCNRESKCGYHKKPAEYFAQNPVEPRSYLHGMPRQSEPINYIESKHLLSTLGNYDENSFVQFLLNLFPDDPGDVWAAVKDYFIGTFADPYGAFTCFPYIDPGMRFCKGKLIRFENRGKRMHGKYDTSSIRTKLKLGDLRYKQVFFGEHLLPKYPNSPIAIVEAEKTAIIASICKRVFTNILWLATGSKSWLNAERIADLPKGRKVILYPDADGFARWSVIAEKAAQWGVNISVSQLIERFASSNEKLKGFDLADYLIRDQQAIYDVNAEREAIEWEGCRLYDQEREVT
jgi:hypothetical protein